MKFWEIVQHLSHLVTTLTTTDVNNTVRVGVLGKSLGNAGLAATEGAGNSAGAALHGGEEGVQHTLAGGQGVVTWELLTDGSGVTHRPEVGHLKIDLLVVGGLEDGNSVGDSVATFGHDLNDTTIELGGSDNLVLGEKIIFETNTNLVTTADEVALLELEGRPVPLLVLVEGGDVDTTGHEDGARVLGDGLEGSLDTVENSFQDTYKM